MKKYIVLALAVSALAVAGIIRNPSHPLTMAGAKIEMVQKPKPTPPPVFPVPECPPHCD